VNEIVTLGGAGRLLDAKRAHQEAHARYQPLYARADGHKVRIDNAVAAISNALTHANPHLEDAV
jgi:hypothetical protein